MSEYNVWVIDDDPSIRWVLEKALKSANFLVSSFENADTALEYLSSSQPDVIITDIRMPGIDGFEFLSILNEKYPAIPTIIMTAHSDLDSAVSAYQGGAFEYLPKPFDIDDAVELTQRACKKSDEYAEKNASKEIDTPDIIGEAPAMQEVFRAIGRLAPNGRTSLYYSLACDNGAFDYSYPEATPNIVITTLALPDAGAVAVFGK